MATSLTPLTQLAAWQALEAHQSKARGLQPAQAVRRGPQARRAPDGGGGGHPPRLLQAPGHRRDPRAAAAPGRGVRPAGPHRGHVPAASTSTSPRTGPCCTWPCARRKGQVDHRGRGRRGAPGARGAGADGALRRPGARSGTGSGTPAKPVRNIVNIGIGGSDLGPVMAFEALRHYSQRDLTFRFVSNVDGTDFAEATRDLDPEETLFIVSSKTFTTLETMTNAATARDWALAGLERRGRGGPALRGGLHQRRRGGQFGIDTENMFGFWDWVGGRYSMTSAIGLSTMIAIGPEHYRAMLAGFHEMDEHFRTAPVRARTCRRSWGCWPSGTATSSARQRWRCCPTTSTSSASPPTSSSSPWRATASGSPWTARESTTRPAPVYWGEPGHQRPALLLPAAAPGDPAGPLRLHRLRPVPEPPGPPPRRC